MERRPFGATGRTVTPLGLGLAALGRPGYINLGHGADFDARTVEAMEARTHAVLDAAWDAGIRYVDAARSYGRAEAFLGTWLARRGHAADALTVGSKWGYTYTADWQVEADVHEVKEHTRPVFERQWGETRAHLGDHLALYQIHSATLDSGVLERADVLAALAERKQAGVAVGLSLSGPRQAATLYRALEVQVDGEPLFDAVQATWNLLERSAAPALQEAHAAGLAVIVKEALANGRLTPRNDADAFGERRALLQREAARLGASLDALALAAALAQPWVTVVLSGAATVAQLRSNVRALDVAWDETAAHRLAALIEPPGTYWAHRSGLAWN